MVSRVLLKPGYDVLIDDLAHMHGKTQHGPRKLSINNMLEAEKLLVNSRHSLCLDPSPRVSTVLGAMHYNAHKYDDCPPKRRPESPRIVVQCAPWASNGPNHLGLCVPFRYDAALENLSPLMPLKSDPGTLQLQSLWIIPTAAVS